MNLCTRGAQSVLVPPTNDDEFRLACEPSLSAFKAAGLDISYEFMSSKDSTNVTFDDWSRLAMRVEAARLEGFQGVAITHGTDTLPHTATALALALAGIQPLDRLSHLPVVITGAQNSVHTVGGDGRFNLENLFRTLTAAIDADCSEVLINFANVVLRGCRTVKTSERKFDAMDSPAIQPLGYIDAKGVQLQKELLHPNTKNYAARTHSVSANWGDGVLTLKVGPGLEPDMVATLLETGKVKALMLESLGEAGVCNEGRNSLISVIHHATNSLNIPVFLGSQFPGGNTTASTYEPGLDAVAAGAIPCFDHTDVAVDVKVRWLLGNKLCSSVAEFRAAMCTSFAGEVTPPNYGLTHPSSSSLASSFPGQTVAKVA